LFFFGALDDEELCPITVIALSSPEACVAATAIEVSFIYIYIFVSWSDQSWLICYLLQDIEEKDQQRCVADKEMATSAFKAAARAELAGTFHHEALFVLARVAISDALRQQSTLVSLMEDQENEDSEQGESKSRIEMRKRRRQRSCVL